MTYKNKYGSIPFIASLQRLALAFVLAFSFVFFTAGLSAEDTPSANIDVPVFFMVPNSAMLPNPGVLTDYRHPDSVKAPNPVGLHILQASRYGLSKRLVESGLIQTGDILLSVRPEWGFCGPYPNIQMGVSHAGFAFVEGDDAFNIDMPLDGEYLGNINSEHYQGTRLLHIIRPRLSPWERSNLLGWAKKFYSGSPQMYPNPMSFNQDYFSPKYTPDNKFVRLVGRIGLGLNKEGTPIDIYCSEFVWALLSLRDCDPNQPQVFAGNDIPSCITPIFEPLPMCGDSYTGGARLGLADGPLAIIDSMGLPRPERDKFINQVFEESRPVTNMSPGHRTVAAQLSPYFGNLKGYYLGIPDKTPESLQIMTQFNKEMKPNYSPASYLINTLLPVSSHERKMDMVGSILLPE